MREKDAMEGEMDRWTIYGSKGFTEEGEKVNNIIKAQPFRSWLPGQDSNLQPDG